MKSTAARFATELQRDNIRFQLTGSYLDIYKCANLRGVVENNIAAAHKLLQKMRARYEQGTALQNDITRYELLVSNLELQLVKINHTIDILNMKEIYGWLLVIAIASLGVILVSYSKVRPFAIFPKWSTVRRVIKHMVRTNSRCHHANNLYYFVTFATE